MSGRVAVISGGVGGAKLALGFSRIVAGDRLSVIVNTGDDFDHLGLRICPDVDTTLYTLGDLANTELGWGRRDETWHFMETLEALGGETWFRLGDADLALHVKRTTALAAGATLSEVTDDIRRRFGIAARILPMSDAPVATLVLTPGGEVGFQDYFVRQRCSPKVLGLRFAGAEAARPSPGAVAALSAPGLAAVVIAPSNPYLSIDPILAVPGMRALIRSAGAPVIAVTSIIQGAAVKGPTAKIMAERGIDPSPVAIARHYGGLIDGFILDERDGALAGEIGMPVHIVDTLMTTLGDRERVARAALAFAAELRARG